MGNPQTSYSLTRTEALTGTFAHVEQRGFTASRACESASIDFGLGVSAGSSDSQVVVGVSGAVLGVAIRSNAHGMDESDDGQYVQYDEVAIGDKDFFWLYTASTSGAYGAEVCMNNTTGAITIGAAVSGTTTPIGWLAQTVTAAGVVKVFVDSRMGVDIPLLALPAHESTHVDGGSDDIDSALAAAAIPAHESTHVSGGSDEIDSALAAGAIPTHASTHENGGADEISVAGLSGVLADEQDAGLIKGVTVDDTDIADTKILKFNSTSGNLEYEDDATA